MENIYTIASKIVKEFEGLVLSPYYCSAFALTTGYGERIDIRPDKLYGGIKGSVLVEEAKKLWARTGGSLKRTNALLAKKFPNLITEQEADEFLQEALKNDYWEQFGKELPKGLTDNQCAALISFVYNIGIGAFKRSSMFRLLKKGNFEKAGKEFPKWKYAGGKALKGLIRRREAEQKLYYS